MSEPAAPDPNDVLSGAMQALADRDTDTALALTAWLAQACPDAAQAHYARAAALLAADDAMAAEAAFEDARLHHALALMQAENIDAGRMANDAAYAMTVARTFYNRFWMGPAIVAAGCAVGRAPDARLILAQALQYQGRSEAAANAFRALLHEQPAPHIHSFLLYSLLFVRDGVRRQAEEAHRWNALWAAPATPAVPSYAVARTAGRRLKVAYMTPAFSHNQARHFLLPLLDHHDRSVVDVTVYVADAAKESPRGDVTMKSYGHLSADDHAAMIRDDRIDVLVDCHGHAANGRLTVVARRPAPVQVSWLNWTHTTGVAAMDYMLHSHSMQAGDDAALFSETIREVGPVETPFRPDPAARVSPAPALTRGYVTFGAFHHPAKVSDATVAAWASILRALPTARLHFKYACYVDPVLQMETRSRFMAHGAASDALEFSGHETGEAYEAAFAHIDLHLDTNPVVGGTTTMAAFSRSVPVLTLRGGDFYARIGVQGALALGMEQMIAADWDDYVAKAIALASDIPGLAALRARVRPALDESIYRDEALCARNMEKAFAAMFETWLATDTLAA
jgi:protein O-GlcNAc transferase